MKYLLEINQVGTKTRNERKINYAYIRIYEGEKTIADWSQSYMCHRILENVTLEKLAEKKEWHFKRGLNRIDGSDWCEIGWSPTVLELVKNFKKGQPRKIFFEL